MKPILFNTEMVQAILDGRKTVTRRLVKFKTGQNPLWSGYIPENTVLYGSNNIPVAKAPFKPDDILYVRETWAELETVHGTPYYAFKADDETLHHSIGENFNRWHPSIHMPKKAARLFLRVKSVRVERLQDITEEQAQMEGIDRMFDHLSDSDFADWASRTCPGKSKSDFGWNNYLWHRNFGKYGTGNLLSDSWPYQQSGYDSPVDSFSSLWNRTVPIKNWPTCGWRANPWVWVIEFERCKKPEATT